MFFYFDFDNSLPSFDTMMKPILAALHNLGGKAKLKELDTKTIEIMKLPQEIISIPHKNSTNRTEIEYRLAWARTYLKTYGLVNNPSHGVWELSKFFDNNTIEDINTAEIVRIVKSKQNLIMTNIESSLAFESFVFGLLAEQLKSQKKSTPKRNDTVLQYDILLPNGIDNIVEEVLCKIKFINSKNPGFRTDLYNFINKFSGKNYGNNLLLITNIIIPERMKQEVYEYAIDRNIPNFILWDGSDLASRTNPDSDYFKYYITPKKSINEDFLSATPTAQKKGIKKNPYIEKIKYAYKEQNLALFLGAGISIESGIPLWSEIIKQLLVHVIQVQSQKENNKALSKKDVEYLNQIAYDNKEDSPLTQIRYIKSAFDDHEDYLKAVHTALYSKTLNSDNNPLLKSIAKLCAPQSRTKGIKSIITYNFDNLLENTLLDNGIEDFNIIYHEDNIPMPDKLNIYHVHGYLPAEANLIDYTSSDVILDTTLVFSEEDYHKVYRDNFSWSNLAQLNSFRDSTCLFVGCSLNDPNLRRLLDVASRNNETPRHYAILRRDTLMEPKKNRPSLLSMYKR